MPIEFVATSRLPTAFGDFNISVFQDPATGEEHVALSKGLETAPNQPVLVRIHSECLTGDAFASLKCGVHFVFNISKNAKVSSFSFDGEVNLGVLFSYSKTSFAGIKPIFSFCVGW